MNNLQYEKKFEGIQELSDIVCLQYSNLAWCNTI